MYAILEYISFYSIFPLAIWTFIKLKTFSLQNVKLLAYFVMFTALNEIITYICYKVASNYLILVINLLCSVDVILITLYYSAQVQFKKLRLPYLLLAALSILYMGYTLYGEPNLFPTAPRLVQNILIICISLYHAYRWFIFPSAKPYEFFVIMAFLGYYILTLTSFAYVGSMSKEWVLAFGALNNGMNVFVNTLLFIALYYYAKYYSVHIS